MNEPYINNNPIAGTTSARSPESTLLRIRKQESHFSPDEGDETQLSRYVSIMRQIKKAPL